MPTATLVFRKHTIMAILCPYLSMTLPMIKLPKSSPKPKLIMANKDISSFLLADQGLDNEVSSMVLVMIVTKEPEKVD